MSSQTTPYKYCTVPQCTNTTIRTPNKIFVCMPRGEETRKIWCNAMKRHSHSKKNKPLSSISMRHCCEDHFVLENDMENYIRWKMMGGAIKLKSGVVPHIFDCQRRTAKRKRKGEVKRHRTLVKEEIQLSTSQLCESINIENDNSSGSNETRPEDEKKQISDSTSDHLLPYQQAYEEILAGKSIRKAAEMFGLAHSSLIAYKRKREEAPPNTPIENITMRYKRKKHVIDEIKKSQHVNQSDSIPTPKLNKKRKVIQSDGRAMIASVYDFLKDEYEFMKKSNSDNCKLSTLANITKRTAAATGVSPNTVTRILKEREMPSPSSEFPEPMAKQSEEESNSNELKAFTTEIIHRAIKDYGTEYNLTTVDSLYTLFKEKKGFTGSCNTFHKILSEIDYEHSKCPMIAKKDTNISLPPKIKIPNFDADSNKRKDFQTKHKTTSITKEKKDNTGSDTEFSDALRKMGYNICKAKPTTAGNGSCLLKNGIEHASKKNSEKSLCSQSNLESNFKNLYCDKSSDMDTDNYPINFTSTQHFKTNMVQEKCVLHANLKYENHSETEFSTSNDLTANSESYDLTTLANIAQRTAETTGVSTVTDFPDESTDIDTETYPINLYDIIDSKASLCIEENDLEANVYIETDSIANIASEENVSEEKFIPEHYSESDLCTNNDSKANIWTEIDSYKKVCPESSANLCPISPKIEIL